MSEELQSFLGDMPESDFIRHFVEKKRFHLKASQPDRNVPLLPWPAINRLIEADTQYPGRLRFRRPNGEIPASMYRYGGGRDRINVEALRGLIGQGLSIVIDRISDLAPDVGDLASAIERRLGCKVWANAYITFGRGGAFKPHYDLHDVIVAQVHGRKYWRDFGANVPSPIKPHAPTARYGAAVWEDWLEPGDILYLPRGEIHEASAEGGDSVHITFGLLPHRGLDAFAWLNQAAEEIELFRMDLPRAAGAAAVREHEDRLKRAMHELVEKFTLTRLFDEGDRSRHNQALWDLGFHHRLDPNTILKPTLRRDIPIDVSRPGPVAVAVGGAVTELSLTARRILALLLARGASRADTVAAALTVAGPDTISAAVTELREHGLISLRAPES